MALHKNADISLLNVCNFAHMGCWAFFPGARSLMPHVSNKVHCEQWLYINQAGPYSCYTERWVANQNQIRVWCCA
jgi:hypothetical protein